MILQIRDDLDLDKIAESGQCFRWQKTDEKSYRIPAGGLCLYISDLGDGRYELDCTEDEFSYFWRDYFDLEENYRKIRELADPEEDPFLFRAVQNGKGIRILQQDPWETLVSFIISQNRNIPSIKKSVELLSERYGEERTDKRGRRYHSFPGPEALLLLGESELKDCRLGYRSAYVHAAARAVAEGTIDLLELAQADGGSALSALTGLYGVGIKVASCVSLFGLHQLDAFPVDVWMRRILEREYPDGYPSARYAPYNGVFQQYMFAYYRNLHQGGREDQSP